MRSAQKRRTQKSKIKNKIKNFLTYSFFAVVVALFIANFFSLNIIEYSFALAKSGGVVDFKNDEKFAIALISSNSLNEIKNLSILVFDKKGNSFSKFSIDLGTKILVGSEEIVASDLLTKISKSSKSELESVLESNFGMEFGGVFSLNISQYNDYLGIVSGIGSVLDLAKISEIPGANVRDSYLMYSFTSGIEIKDRREFQVKSLASFDKEVRDIYLDSVIGKEALSITVVNATSINGLAKNFSRKILNSGGRVVDITSSDTSEEKSFIIYKENTETLKMLSNYLGITKLVSSDEIGLKYPEIVKSDIVVVVGLDKK